jgi:CBS domain containing-hemolysin-like protein
VSGWLTQKLGGFPKAGDTLMVSAHELRVEEMDGPRVARLKIVKRRDSEDPTTILRREPQKSQ